MKLWETYFRLWDKFGKSLNLETSQSEPEEKLIEEEERGKDYYGFVCDVGTCIESGV